MIDDAEVVEGNAGTSQLVFAVTLSVPSDRQVEVNYRTDGGTARADDDYQAVADRLTIPPGQTRGELVVNVFGDMVDEPDETLFVELTHPVGAEHRARRDAASYATTTRSPPLPS